MKILGIDPGLATIGFGLIRHITHDIQYELIDYGIISTPAHTELAIRLNILRQDLKSLLNELQPEIISLESLFFAKNIKTAMQVAHARGVILEQCWEYMQNSNNIISNIKEFTPLQVKQMLTGNGRATKQEVQQIIMDLFKLKTIIQPDDANDAVAIAYIATL